MYAAREGSLEAAARLGRSRRRPESDGSGRHDGAGSRHHQRPLRHGGMLAGKGADPNIGDTAGMAALYAAVDMNTLAEIYGRPARKSTDQLSALGLMKKLLDHGANPNAQLKAPTLQRAHTPGDRNLGEGATPLMRAARNGDAAAMRLLLARRRRSCDGAEESHHGADARGRSWPRSRHLCG